MLGLFAATDFNDPKLSARLQVRIRPLQDAFDTLDAATVSDVRTERGIGRLGFRQNWRPYRESNPGYHRERVVS